MNDLHDEGDEHQDSIKSMINENEVMKLQYVYSQNNLTVLQSLKSLQKVHIHISHPFLNGSVQFYSQ